MGTVVRIAAPRSTTTPRRAKIIRPVQFRNVSGRGGHVPPLDHLLREGRASSRRIHDHESGIRRFPKAVLIEWLDQAERLWIAAETHKLKGKYFLVFATQIGIDRSSAYELIKLHPNRKQVVARCRKENHWPGWEVCAGWFKEADIEHELPTTTPTRGILTPTWQRFKVADIEYGTPQALFDHYDRIHHFTLDVCSTAPMAKCKRFYTPEQDGLKQVWSGVCWMNPPYTELGRWVKKAYEASQQGAVVVALLPVFTDAGWFHDYGSHATIDLLKGRLQFTNRNANGYTPFGHGVFVFRKKSARQAKRLTISLDDHRIGTHSSRALSGAKTLASRAG
jgi:phage N-6-adenine-methyltransferase